MATVNIHQTGGMIQHTIQGKGIFFKITERKGKVFSSESLKITLQMQAKEVQLQDVDEIISIHENLRKPGLMWTQSNMWMLLKLLMDTTLVLLKIRLWLKLTHIQNTRLIC